MVEMVNAFREHVVYRMCNLVEFCIASTSRRPVSHLKVPHRAEILRLASIPTVTSNYDAETHQSRQGWVDRTHHNRSRQQAEKSEIYQGFRNRRVHQRHNVITGRTALLYNVLRVHQMAPASLLPE